MKKLFLIALALVTIQISAQNKKSHHKKGEKTERKNHMEDYTPEEMAELKTKQMTLHLDLNDTQQKQVMALNLKNAKILKEARAAHKEKMESKEELSSDDRFKMKSKMLDRQIDMKQKMKTILSAEQYTKWEKLAAERSKKMKHQKKRSKKHHE